MEGRAPAAPWNKDAEVAVLSAAMIDGEARRLALERLEASDFYREAHRRIFAAFDRLNGRGQGLDLVTLSDELTSRGELEAVGGTGHLNKLADAVPTAANVEHHVEVLREKATLRRLIEAARDVENEARDAAAGGAVEAVTRARDLLREIEERTAATDGEGLRTAAEILADPDAARQPPVVAEHLAWAGRTVLFAGREKSGKSTVWRWAVARRSRGLPVWGEGPPAPGGPVETLYWAEEPPADVARDLDRLGADLDRIHVRDMRGLAGDRFATLRRDLEAVAPGLVVVDTLPTFVDDRRPESGESSDWAPVMNRLARAALDHDAAMGLLHHATKSDGGYRDSTAIGAGVDCVLEMRRDPAEGENVRKVTAYPRSSIRAKGYAYRLAGTDDDPRLELLDGSLPLDVRIISFVRRNPESNQRAICDGVRGRTAEIRDRLEGLVDAGEVERREDGRSYSHRIPETPDGTGTETVGNGPGNDGADSGGRTVSRTPRAPEGGGGPETPAGSAGDQNTPRRCACGNRIGPTAMTCGGCKKRRRETLSRLPDPAEVTQVGDPHPTSPRRIA